MFDPKNPPIIDCSEKDLRCLDKLLGALEGLENSFVFSANQKSECSNRLKNTFNTGKKRSSTLKPTSITPLPDLEVKKAIQLPPQPTQPKYPKLDPNLIRNLVQETMQSSNVTTTSKTTGISVRDPRVIQKAPILLSGNLKKDKRIVIQPTPNGVKGVKKLSLKEYKELKKDERVKEKPNQVPIEEMLTDIVRNQLSTITVEDIQQFDHTKFTIEKMLPGKILSRILMYLPVKDVKAAREVNKRWFEITNTKEFRERERLIFCGIYPTGPLLEICMLSRNRYMNLEFYKVNFKGCHKEFFEGTGDWIYSLHFVDCTVDNLVWSQIILNCNNLKELKISYLHSFPDNMKFVDHQILAQFSNNDVILEKLENLSFNLGTSQWISNAILGHMFKVCHNMTGFSLTCKSLNFVDSHSAVPPRDIKPRDLKSETTFTFSSVLHQLHYIHQLYLSGQSAKSIEKLTLNVETVLGRPGFAIDYVMKYVELTSLRKLDIQVDLKRTNIDIFVEFVTKQIHLKKFYCEILHSSKKDLGVILDAVLEKCIDLRALGVSCKREVVLSSQSISRIITSKLCFLKIDVDNLQITDDNIENDDFENKLNNSMRIVTITSMPVKYLKLLIQIFRSLTYLELLNVTDEVLRSIWMYQTDLEHLKLTDISQCTTEGFPKVYSFSRLKKLQALTLSTADKDWAVSDSVFFDFELPELRCFSVDLKCNTEMNSKLLKMLNDCKRLEYVSLSLRNVPRPSWILSSTGWERLKYFRIDDITSTRFKRKEYEKFFLRTNTLRALVHKFNCGTDVFYWNLINQKLENKEAKTAYRISSEKIGGVFIDWLWF